jgi:hypothetical protein
MSLSPRRIVNAVNLKIDQLTAPPDSTDLNRFVKADAVKWWPLIKEFEIRAEWTAVAIKGTFDEMGVSCAQHLDNRTPR